MFAWVHVLHQPCLLQFQQTDATSVQFGAETPLVSEVAICSWSSPSPLLTAAARPVLVAFLFGPLYIATLGSTLDIRSVAAAP